MNGTVTGPHTTTKETDNSRTLFTGPGRPTTTPCNLHEVSSKRLVHTHGPLEPPIALTPVYPNAGRGAQARRRPQRPNVRRRRPPPPHDGSAFLRARRPLRRHPPHRHAWHAGAGGPDPGRPVQGDLGDDPARTGRAQRSHRRARAQPPRPPPISPRPPSTPPTPPLFCHIGNSVVKPFDCSVKSRMPGVS
jgi:hypothetical protein